MPNGLKTALLLGALSGLLLLIGDMLQPLDVLASNVLLNRHVRHGRRG